MNQLEKLVHKMQLERMDYLIVSDPTALEYLIDIPFHADERLLVFLVAADGDHRLFLNRLVPLEEFAYPIIWHSDTDRPIEQLASAIGEGKVGIDKNWPSHFLIDLLKQKPELKLCHGSPLIDRLRQVKTDAEIEAMRHASALNDLAMEQLIAEIEPGMTEQLVAQRLAEIYQEIGADGFSFNPIIGFGTHSADPHHQTGEGLIGESGPLVIDIGCKKAGFCADMTRTIYIGTPSDEFLDIYEIVRAANLNAIAAVRPGARFSDIDAAARDTIEQAGYGEYFTHRTGHSIGREVHEYGNVASNNHDILEPGMIFSIEPGIYLPERFGVRIEDLVLVTQQGVEVLNHVSKDIRRASQPEEE